MKLLHYKTKWPATVVFYLSLLLGIFILSTDYEISNMWEVPVYSLFGGEGIFGLEKQGWTKTGFVDEILTILIVCSGLIATFSREKVEDELISKIRLESLSLAIIINYGLLLVANFLIFGLFYFDTLIVFLFAPIIMFNIIF